MLYNVAQLSYQRIVDHSSKSLNKSVKEVKEDWIHNMLKSVGYILKAKRHHIELNGPIITCKSYSIPRQLRRNS